MPAHSPVMRLRYRPLMGRSNYHSQPGSFPTMARNASPYLARRVCIAAMAIWSPKRNKQRNLEALRTGNLGCREALATPIMQCSRALIGSMDRPAQVMPGIGIDLAHGMRPARCSLSDKSRKYKYNVHNTIQSLQYWNVLTRIIRCNPAEIRDFRRIEHNTIQYAAFVPWSQIDSPRQPGYQDGTCFCRAKDPPTSVPRGSGGRTYDQAFRSRVPACR